MQETRHFKPSTVSRRFSVAAGFYRTCVIDGLLEHSPAEHVRRPSVSPESPTLGFTHLQFEALLTAARQSTDRCDFALVAMLGLLGLRIFEATGADITDLGEEHGHRVLRVCGKGTKVVLIPLPPAVGRAIDRAIGARTGGPILLNSRGARMDRHAATRRLRRLAETAGVRIAMPHPHMLRHTFVTTGLDAGVDLRDVQIAARHADPRTTMRYDRARKNLDRHPNYILAAYMASGRVGFLVGFLVGLLAEHAEDLGEPYTRHLAGKVRELRFHLLRQQTRVTYWLAPGRRVILLTVFPKTRSAETAEVARALHAQKICEAEHGTAHQVFDREVN